MAPTASAIAAKRVSVKFCPRRRPTPSVRAARIKIATSSTLLNFASFFVRGVSSSIAPESSWEMRPTSVRSPVAVTTPTPVPYVTRVEAYAILERSARTLSESSTRLASFATGSDSPVNAASATCKSREEMRRISAGMRAPAASWTISPGTRSWAGSRKIFPPRTTTASTVIVFASAAMDSSARASWIYPTTALISTTPKMTAASVTSLRTAVTTLAATRIRTRGFLNCSRNLTNGLFPLRGVN